MEGGVAELNVITPLGYIVDRENILNPLWNGFMEMDSVDTISTQMLLMEKYEIALGIQKPEHKNPVTLCTMKESNQLHIGSLTENIMFYLISRKIPEMTGMSVNELLNLPTYLFSNIIRACRRAKRLEYENENTAEMRKLMKQDKMLKR